MDFHVPFFKSPDTIEFDDVKSWKVVDPKECIRTGDILMFSGSSLLSSGIKAFTTSRWNHIGLACWCELEHHDSTTSIEFFCFEMGSQPFTDLMTREYVDKGVRLVRFGDIADMYDMVAVRRINHQRGEDWSSRFREFMLNWKNTPFPRLHILAKNYLITPTPMKGETTCACLVAHMLDYMDVYKLPFDPSQLAPDDFANHSRAFPDNLFKSKETVIYRDPKLVDARLTFLLFVIIVIVVMVILLLRKQLKSKH